MLLEQIKTAAESLRNEARRVADSLTAELVRYRENTRNIGQRTSEWFCLVCADWRPWEHVDGEFSDLCPVCHMPMTAMLARETKARIANRATVAETKLTEVEAQRDELRRMLAVMAGQMFGFQMLPRAEAVPPGIYEAANEAFNAAIGSSIDPLTAALQVAVPLARHAAREQIRHLAAEHRAVCNCLCDPRHAYKFADLIEEATRG